MPMEAGPLRIHKDTQKDILMVNQVTKGKFGAAQLQIALNLTPVRALAKKILDDKVTEISGERQRFAHPKAVAKLTNRLAVRGICGFSLFSAKSPLAALNQSPAELAKKAGAAAGSKYARVNKIVAAYQKDKLKKYGGFDGLKKKIALHREAEANKLLASGIPPQIVNAKKERQKSEDSWVIAEAARQLGLEEVPDEEVDSKESKDEASGFDYSRMYPRSDAASGLFHRKKKMSTEQRIAAAQARTEAAQAEADARAAEQEAKDAEDALKNPPDDKGDDSTPDGGDGAAPASASGLDARANLKRLQKIARIKRYKAHHAKRRYHKAMKAGMMGASATETAAQSAVPGGPATFAVAKFAYKRGGKKHAASAVKLAKARNGDPTALASIKKTNDAAKKGDPNAKAEMKRLNTVNKLAAAVHRRESQYTKLLRSGVAGMKQYSTKQSGPYTGPTTVEGLYHDTLSEGCS